MTNNGRRFFISLCAALAALLVAKPALAANTIIFSTAPTQPPAQTLKMYGPLAQYLSNATGKKVVLEPAKMFLQYTNEMRAGHYDLLFDGPHFVGWRMKHLGDTVVAKLPGAIVFLVVVRDDAGVKKIDDLAGKKVCSFASPNLLTLGFLDLFPDPARLPVMVKAKTFMGALKCVQAGHGVAAVMRDKFWYKRTPAQKKGLHLLYVSKTPYPHRAFTVSSRVDPATRHKIEQALLSPEGSKMAKAILGTFHVKSIVPAPSAQYKGMGRLLKPVWGFN